jgi:hypothetical protein
MLLITKTKFWIIQYIIVQIKQQHNFDYNTVCLIDTDWTVSFFVRLWTADWGGIYLNSQLTNFFNMKQIRACLTNDEIFYVAGSNLAG